jgi:hypothetical protein
MWASMAAISVNDRIGAFVTIVRFYRILIGLGQIELTG